MSLVYRFGPFTLNPSRRALSRDGVEVVVTGKAFDILVYLVQHPNRVVTKQDLMKAIWSDTIVEEGNLTQNISLLRKALGEQQLIVTVARQGYQFVGSVTEAEEKTQSQTPRRWPTAVTIGAIAIVAILAAVFAWRRPGSAANLEKVRLAVLPFENLTGDSAENYLADGLTEELTTQLARLDPAQLGVIARTSVMQYKHGAKRMDQIGRDLSVRYAIESSLRGTANRLRVTVQLIRVADQSHVWANDFDYNSHDILGVEDSVAGAVAKEVKLRLGPSHARAVNPAAVEALMRGRTLLRTQLGRGSWVDAKHYIEQAIALDSGYALAWAWEAVIDRVGADHEWIPPKPGLQAARQAVDRSLAIDPNLPEGWAQRGQFQRLIEWDWAGARASFQRGLALDPENVDAIGHLATITANMGHVDEALALAQHAVDLDPVDPVTLGLMGSLCFDAGRLDDARKWFERIPPDIRGPIWSDYLVDVALAQGRLADAAALVPQVADSEYQMEAYAVLYTKQGHQRAADSVMALLVEHYHADYAFQIAGVYALRGQTDSAFAWLDHAYAQRDEGFSELKADPKFASLRGDPRFAALLMKLRLPQ